MKEKVDTSDDVIQSNGVQNINEDGERSYVCQCNNIYNIKKEKPKKKRISIVSTIIAIPLLIIICVCVFGDVRRSNYLEKARHERKSNNFLQAAEYYHNAYTVANKLFILKKDKKLLCAEAECYMLQAFKEEDENIANQHYARAANIYSGVIIDKENNEIENYVDALAGLSFVYSFSGHAIDKEWIDLIKQITENSKKLDDLVLKTNGDNDAEMESIYRMLRIYYALGEFYYGMIQTDYMYMYNAGIANAALECYEQIDELLKYAKKGDKNIITEMDPVYSDKLRAELLIFIACSPTIQNHEQYATQAIELCQSALNNASIKKISTESFISLKFIIAEGYRVLAEYGEKKDENMKKAYDELQPLFDMKSEKIPIELIIDVGYSAVFTGFCTMKI